MAPQPPQRSSRLGAGVPLALALRFYRSWTSALMRLRAATSTSLLLTQRHEHLKRAGPPRPPHLRVCDRAPLEMRQRAVGSRPQATWRPRRAHARHSRARSATRILRRPPGCAPGCPAQAAAAARAKARARHLAYAAAGDREGFAELLLERAEELRAEIRSATGRRFAHVRAPLESLAGARPSVLPTEGAAARGSEFGSPVAWIRRSARSSVVVAREFHRHPARSRRGT